MTKPNFRDIKREELTTGRAIWFEGKNFLDGSWRCTYDGNGSLCGPFLIEKVWLYSNVEPRVELVDTATGEHRNMMYSWLKVPKEK